MKTPFFYYTILLIMCWESTLIAKSSHTLHFTSPPQDPTADSLQQVLATSTAQDSNYVMTLLRLSNHISEEQPKQSTAYAEEAVQIAQKLSNTSLMANALNIQGACYLTEDRFADALLSFKASIPLFRKVNNGVRLGNAYNNASLAYKHLNDFVQSLTYLTTAEQIYDSIGYQVGIARANNNLGSLFRLQEEPRKAEMHYLKALNTHIALNNEGGKSTAQLNLGLLYNELKEYDKSRKYLDSALTYFTHHNIATKRVTALIGLGELSMEEAKRNKNHGSKTDAYTQAEVYFQTALQEAVRLDMPKSRFTLLRDMASVKAAEGNMEPSKLLAQQARALADTLGTPHEKSRAEETLSHVYQQSGQWQEALHHYQQYKAWEDSVLNEKTTALYKSQQVLMEVARRDRELEMQDTQLALLNEQIILENRWKWTLGLASLLFLITGLLYYQKYRIRNTYSLQLETQNRLITDQKEEIETINHQLEDQIRLRQQTDETIRYFSTSLFGKNTMDEILWDIAKNCTARLGLIDCVIYLLDEERSILYQKAAYGPKNPQGFEIANPIEIPLGKGIVGSIALTGKAELINDTSQDERYIIDGEFRYAELAVPLIYQHKVIGVIDSEHPEKGFYSQYHLDGLTTIAAICASKIAQAQADEKTRKAEETKREAEQIKALDLMKSRFFANISHEFRTPLNLILGPLRTHEEHIPPLELGMMQRNAHRLLRLVNQLMDLSKLEVGELRLEYQQADVLNFLREIVVSFVPLAEEKQILYQIDIPMRKQLARFDPDKLEKITYNLLSNALKFTPSAGKVSIHVAIESPNTLRLSVSDTGLGIPTALQDKIFDRFYQVDDSSTRSYEGSGIGLALTKELVDLMEGDIWVDSEAQAGTSFTVLLPLQAADGDWVQDLHLPAYPTESKVEVPLEPAEHSTEEKPLVLIVEDNPDLRAYIRNNLGSTFSYLEAVHGKEGWDMALKHIPDLIITDIMMPEMDGISLTDKLKKDERSSHIPIIMLTARDDHASKREGFHSGADQYLTKPFDISELRERVGSLLRQRRQLQQKYSQEVQIRPSDITTNGQDAAFLQRCLQIVETHIGESEFSVEQFQKEIGMSRMQLHRKLKALTNQSATEFMRDIRLQRAAQILLQEQAQVAEAAYDVGFNHLSYFAKCFKEKFGLAPSDYARQNSNPA